MIDNTGTTSRGQIVADNNTQHQGSMYTAAGCLSNGLPVIAWYDRTNQNLVFSYGSGIPSTTSVTGPDSIVNTLTKIDFTAKGTGTEYVYVSANHGLSAGTAAAGNTNAQRVLVRNTGIAANENRVRYVRRVSEDTFVLNNNTTDAANIGADCGDSIEVIPPISISGISAANPRVYTH